MDFARSFLDSLAEWTGGGVTFRFRDWLSVRFRIKGGYICGRAETMKSFDVCFGTAHWDLSPKPHRSFMTSPDNLVRS